MIPFYFWSLKLIFICIYQCNMVAPMKLLLLPISATCIYLLLLQFGHKSKEHLLIVDYLIKCFSMWSFSFSIISLFCFACSIILLFYLIIQHRMQQCLLALFSSTSLWCSDVHMAPLSSYVLLQNILAHQTLHLDWQCILSSPL